MKDKRVYKTVKNIIHNDLGLTKDEVTALIDDYVNKHVELKIKEYKNSREFEALVHKTIKELVEKEIMTSVRSKLTFTKINVKVDVIEDKKEGV